ncbi:MAG TPA: flagellar biosynthetic protein FliR [Candidatus Competibacteraceae bacterium]|nr:flagellar biosynthetic protein FliR [Candidatus Competibacteraceae bacterium]MCP5133978.1 flagellar biosynthetic protein FliR [Gammaproteobacteria bacterium]HPF59097.1 flagellar biosynthetic protein FliR [Candidatus Competibacteraceae bacterium]HRY18934.1 flagellar biosynthetic protein FliR [Candidatus Competibacteraceae bacterium]
MQISSAEAAAWAGTFLWPLTRVAAMVLTAPVFSSRVTPRRVRLMVALALTWAILPFVPPMPMVEPLSPAGLLVTAQQLLIGLSMGFLLRLVFGALELGGQVIATQVGLGFASLVDPQSGAQSALLSQFYTLLGTLVFLGLNGHLMLIQLLADSFTVLPVAPTGADRDWLWIVVNWAGHMFAGAVLVALPAIASLLVVNMAFGVMVRAAPQLNIFAVGFPITLILGLLIILYSLPNLMYQLNNLFSEAFRGISQLAGGAG